MRRAGLLAVALLGFASVARADGGAPDAGPGNVEHPSCVEHLPSGKNRPKMTEKFPDHALSGHAVPLVVEVEHGKGETVLPHGFRLHEGGDDERALAGAGFALPDPDGGAGPSVAVKTDGERATTTVTLNLVPLPRKPGRNDMTLPPLPVSIARASGELVTVCTKPHEIRVEDPIANTPDPKPKPNPDARRQREVWTLARDLTIATLIALAVGALVAWLIGRFLRREKPLPPPPPPRDPWVVAMEELHDLRHAGLIERERFVEHYDRVSHIVRKYLGDRYRYDGLESTTRESLSVLRRVVPPITVLEEIEAFMRHADLVKFARLTPSADECETALSRGEEIVSRTIPPMAVPKPGAPS
ncbi:MAG: hypothetical protein KC776_31965 [Myxococcales bacterium]|nr:hypothetical protein [Myxococcales bacterium]MCB9579118.1 hypothetical protein [Polyangiaceae bacterium]